MRNCSRKPLASRREIGPWRFANFKNARSVSSGHLSASTNSAHLWQAAQVPTPFRKTGMRLKTKLTQWYSLKTFSVVQKSQYSPPRTGTIQPIGIAGPFLSQIVRVAGTVFSSFLPSLVPADFRRPGQRYAGIKSNAKQLRRSWFEHILFSQVDASV